MASGIRTCCVGLKLAEGLLLMLQRSRHAIAAAQADAAVYAQWVVPKHPLLQHTSGRSNRTPRASGNLPSKASRKLP